MKPYATGALPYATEQVGALKRTLLDSLKNAANIRGFKSDEWVVVTVFGTESVEAGLGAAGSFGGGGGGGGGATSRFGGGGSASNVTSPGAGTSFWPGRRCSLLTDPWRVCASLAPRLGQKSLAANVVVFMKRGA
jgi:hypothetical protein